MEQIIQLALDDDIFSIQSRLEWAEARQIVLVIPPKNKALRNLVHMKMLARQADALNLDLTLVTQHTYTRDLAKEAGIKTFATEWLAQRTGYISETAAKIAPEETTSPKVQGLEAPSPPRVRIQDRKLVLVVGRGRVNIWQQLGALLLVGLLGLVVVLLVLVLAPQATVYVTPRIDLISTELILTADPAPEVTTIDPANNIIPAKPVQVELTLFDSVPTINTEAAPVDFAVGSVVFFNRTQDVQRLPISTTLRTSSGVPIEFITTHTTTIPAGTGATTVTNIIAVEPGPSGNVSAGQINRFAVPTLGLLARVINETATSGGSVRQAGVVTEEDKGRVRSKLRQVIQQRGYEMIVADLDEQEFVPPESLQVIELNLTFDKFAGDVAETFGGDMRAVVRATAIGSFHANQLAYYSLLERVPDGQTLLTEGLRFSAGGVEAVENRAITFPVLGEGYVVSEVDIDRLRENITFKPIGEAQAWISDNMPVVSVPGIEVSPNWLGRLPFFPFRIEVVVNDAEPLISGQE